MDFPTKFIPHIYRPSLKSPQLRIVNIRAFFSESILPNQAEAGASQYEFNLVPSYCVRTMTIMKNASKSHHEVNAAGRRNIHLRFRAEALALDPRGCLKPLFTRRAYQDAQYAFSTSSQEKTTRLYAAALV